MITYNPIWQTSTILPDMIEGAVVSQSLLAVSTAMDLIPAGSTDLQLGLDASLVTNVLFNGSPLSYTASGTSLFFTAVENQTNVEVETSVEIIYTMIGGKLPKGLLVTQNGLVQGIPEGIKDPAGETYAFTVRVANGQAIRDRTFRVVVYPVTQAITWNMAGLPLESADPSLSTEPYRVLGEVKRGESFSFAIDVINPDDDDVVLSIGTANAVIPAANIFNTGLPDGLTLNGTSIEGVVLPNTVPGRYFFSIVVVAPAAPPPIAMMIEVLSLRTQSFKRPVKIQWKTPSGSLGTLRELQISNLSTVAINPNGDAINYSLIQGTGNLPPGLLLNPETGDVEGRVLFVQADTSYSFSVRASSGSIFADRTFSIDVKDVYQSENISEVSLKFQGRDKKKARQGYADLIPRDWLYRPQDEYFGLVTEPYIHVARGLYADDTLSELEYREDITCWFGPHEIARVSDLKGNPLYEVIYRRIIDPMDQDPFGKDVRSDGLVINYVQSKTDQQIHPMSIWNMRYDLLVDYGTDAGDILPEWMTADTVSSGYKTAFAVAFLLPGNASSVLSLLDSTITQNGYAVKFDRVLLNRVGTQITQFDASSPQMLPIYVPAGVTSITPGRWTGLVTEIFTVAISTDGNGRKIVGANTLEIIDQNDIDMNIDAGSIAFPPINNPRMVYLMIDGSVPNGSYCSNSPIGEDLLLGPFVSGVSRITLNGGDIPLTSFTPDTTDGILVNQQPFVANSEVVVYLSETTFDNQSDPNGQTIFDFKAINIGKYVKLTDEFKQYP